MLCFAEKQCFMITNIYAVMLIAYIQALRLWRQTLKRIKGLSKLCSRILSSPTSKQTQEVGNGSCQFLWYHYISPSGVANVNECIIVPIEHTKCHNQCSM